MATVSERVQQLKQGFMELHEKGYTIPEIAGKFNVNPSTVYAHLEEIAKEHGFYRTDLLQVVKTSSSTYLRTEEQYFKVDSGNLSQDFKIAIDSVDKLISTVDNILEQFEEENKNGWTN